MSDQERAAIRQAGADDARRSRARQGLPERIEDPAAVAILAAILRDARAPLAERKHTHETSGIGNPTAETVTTTRLRRSRLPGHSRIYSRYARPDECTCAMRSL
jgi:hypothetical protein